MKDFTAAPGAVALVLQTPAGRHLPYQQVHNNITLLNLTEELRAIRHDYPVTSLTSTDAMIDRLCDVLLYLLATNCIDVSSTYQK